MKKINVDVPFNPYSIYIGEGMLEQPALFQPLIVGEQVMIITNTTLAELYLEKTRRLFTTVQCDTMVIPDGEQYKTLDTYSTILDALLKKNHTRQTTLVALGGGVVGDITGFAAASYQRGVNVIQLPTSLLAQVDASVGGKTAVNHPLGKNMIGAFHQPKAVFIDINTLDTLPQRHFQAGLAEIIKSALLADAEFFEWLEAHMCELLEKNHDALTHAIERSCAIKTKIVALDEKESNVRALLNLGHTFGHAIEHLLGYGAWLHGEAVAVGTVLAAQLSAELGNLSKADVRRIESLFQKANLPTTLPKEIKSDALLNCMLRDKKMDAENLAKCSPKLVLLASIGTAELNSNVPRDQLVGLVQRSAQ